MDTVPPEKFFLEADDQGSDFKFLAPSRQNALCIPLIDGVETFKAMEERILKARESVYMSWWVFNPRTPLLSRAARNSGVKTWSQLLISVVKKGGAVYIILNDFDPILQNGLHKYAWSSYRRLVKDAMRSLNKSQQDRFQVICSIHEARIKFAAKGILAGRLNGLVKDLNKRAKKGVRAAKNRFQDMPGLWQNVEFVAKTKKFKIVKKPEYIIYPAAHHQKICIVDDKVAFGGGLDVNTGRIDDQKHSGGKTLWHDIHCGLEGKPVQDVTRNYFGRWNREEIGFKKFVQSVNKSSSFKIQTLDTKQIKGSPNTVTGKPGKGVVQIHRTLSIDAPFSRVPNNIRKDIENAYEKSIKLAKNYIYIENQYVRSGKIADWIIANYKKNKKLKVIVLLPVAPEEVAGPGGGDDVTLHGLHLQHEVLTKLQAALGKNIGIYSAVKKQKAPKKHKTNAYNSLQIYVHSKLLIVDDIYAIIGSANTNDRSFRVDTELNAGWYEPKAVARFRVRLWRELLGSPKNILKWPSAKFVVEWDKIAKANAKKAPHRRKGFVVPHDPNKFPGTKNDLIPEEFTEYLDLSESGGLESAPV